ncbi:YscQ/HrcQ family type III secretion apparatus protein [Paraburkholderia sp. NMBU_R16]|uniref:type III secretion system cytoplasmic ring protein SctQ n=1 Tax=Paraburkholderia sp. NMBU_R16 TaxID=2698676 RepID=UPI0015675A0B|nr:type III secretion system cytoplasmic ring protein SctQ [Paraburkholderia sp. NMBU_R16]NRO94443.1 YscQ/HrcQ family type III secretion apparatus protein [Paraburkholderia sp. NMBU_R16]
MTHSPRAIVLRRADAAHVAQSRLARVPSLRVSLGDASTATLELRRAAPTALVEGSGLAISTRFGCMSWHDCEAWLLALTGIDPGLAEHRAAREAFVHYALAALPAPLGAALGDPRYEACASPSQSSCAGSDKILIVSLSCTVPHLRVAMLVRLNADALNEMIEHVPWQFPSPPIAPWLERLPGRARVIAGTLAMPSADIRSLVSGDILRLPSPAFDTAGVGRVVFAGLAWQIRWRDADSSFEVLHPMHDDTSCPRPSATGLPPDTPNPVDPARLPVQLSFVIGTLELPLGALAAAGRGTLLRLAEGMPPTVRIEANGVPVGYGELVDLDGRLAVEITQWRSESGTGASP